MKIKQKIILGFVSVSLLIAVSGYISVRASRQTLQENIEHHAAALSREILRRVDETIYSRVEQIQAYATGMAEQPVLKESNEEFEKLENASEYILNQDRAWQVADKGQITEFMELVPSIVGG